VTRKGALVAGRERPNTLGNWGDGRPCTGGSSCALRAAAVGLVRGQARQLRRSRHDGVHERVGALDALQMRLEELARRARACAERAGRSGGREQAESVVHRLCGTAGAEALGPSGARARTRQRAESRT